MSDFGTMPVAERFVSINGEGAHAGQFSAFIRFTGCNLACSYCDTQWACQPDCPAEALTVAELVEYVRQQATPCVTLTGGEPLLQPQLPVLVDALIRETDCFVEIETNGSCDIQELDELRASTGTNRLGITLDVKSPSSGMSAQMLEKNYVRLAAQDCIKFVVGSKEDLDAARAVLEAHEMMARCSVYFSPVFGQIQPAEIVEYLGDTGLKNARVQLQLHKLIWPNVEKGV